MFDTVKFEMKCPRCGNIIKDFQSKDLGCFLDEVDVSEVVNFYSGCYKCNIWIEFIRKPNNIIPTLDEVLKDFYMNVEERPKH
jgi:hypothetical protein